MISVLMNLAAQVRDTVDRVRRLKTRRRAVQELRRSLALIVDLGALEASVATRIKEFFDPDLLVILQLDPATSSYRPGFRSGLGQEALEEVAFSPHGRLAQWFRTNETCLVVDRDRGVVQYLEERERQHLARLKARLCAPLLARNHLAGILVLGSARLWRPTRRDADLLLQFANQASLAFQNAALYREQGRRLDRLHRADRLAAVGQLAAGVAHEVRNPLTAIRSTMQYLAGSFEDQAKQVLVEELIGEVDRIDQTISGLLSLTRPSELEPEEVDLGELIRQTARLVEAAARKQGVAIEVTVLDATLAVWGDPAQLKQVFLNLILNALQAMPNGGRITLAARLERPHPPAREAPRARVDIVDDGPGIPPDKLKTVFDPLFTTKQEGTGLGLTICHGIVERHEGDIELESTVGAGTTVTVRLPLPNRQRGEGEDLPRGR